MTSVRSLLRDYGIRPRKHLGQSFLEDKNIINKIILAAEIHMQDVVVEIGAGLGIMTDLLASRAGKVIAIDVDPRMAAILKDRLHDRSNVEIIEKDVMLCDFSALRTDNRSSKLKIIGNIPYNISTQILFLLVKYRCEISSMVLLFQKEVVDRITASPGTKEYGIPSVLLAMYADASREMNVPASCFYPPPKVTSSLLKITIRETPLVYLEDDDYFSRIVKTAFSQRRKTLLNNLRNLSADYRETELTLLLKNLGIDGKRRGETLTVEEFGSLSNALYLLDNKMDKVLV